MGIKFTNNALTLLAASLSVSDSVVTVAPGSGARFPAVAGGSGDYFVLTMENASAQREFIRVNHRVSDTFGSGSFPCVRGYFGSTPRVWAAGDSVDLRWSADVVQDYLQTISGRYLGAFALAPVADAFGGAIKTGDLYYDTAVVNLLVWSGTAWVASIVMVPQLRIADAAPSLNVGEQWFESDSGNLYLRYQNPDLTFTLIGLNVPTKDVPAVPVAEKGAVNGVATLDATGKIPAAQLPVSAVLGFAQCHFRVQTPTACVLACFGGNALTINGTPRIIPQAGVTFNISGAPLNDTKYYIYAFWDGTAIQLEASTTAWAQNAGGLGGMAVKTGDTTRTLVGMIYRNAAGQFVDSAKFRYVRSFYNDPGVSLGVLISTGSIVISGGPYVEVDAASRLFGVFWDSEYLEGSGHISANAAAATIGYCSIGMDPTTNFANPGIAAVGAGQYSNILTEIGGLLLTEGLHVFSLLSGVSGTPINITTGFCGLSLHTRRNPIF